LEKKIIFYLFILSVFFSGCKSSENLKIAEKVYELKVAFDRQVLVFSHDGNPMAAEINKKLIDFQDLPQDDPDKPTAEDIINLKRAFINIQAVKIKTQTEYIKKLERILTEVVDPKELVLTKE